MKLLLVFLSAVALLSSCSKKMDNKCQYDPCAIAAPASEVAQLEAYLSTASITATKHCSGMYYTIVAAGSGASATGCSSVSVTYKGQLTNGTIFDQRTSSFGLDQVIQAWTKGVPLIKAGGKIKLYCPPTLGYGSQVVRDNAGNTVIPANSILIFEVELINVY
jgi:FKBP-type peptidyl-prolyl cis-trans isomerase FkpA